MRLQDHLDDCLTDSVYLHVLLVNPVSNVPTHQIDKVLLQVMDHGYPQFTEAKILSEYIKTDAHKMEVRAMRICYV